jgi:hypothetical protein
VLRVVEIAERLSAASMLGLIDASGTHLPVRRRVSRSASPETSDTPHFDGMVDHRDGYA